MDPKVTPPSYTSPEGPGYQGGFAPNQPVGATVVVIQQDEPPIRDDFLWSLFNTIYLNACCLGFVALSYSVKSRDRKLFGDKIGAVSYGTRARKFNIAATVITLICLIIIIIINVTAK